MEEKKSNKPVAALVLGIVSCAMTLFGLYGSIVGLDLSLRLRQRKKLHAE